MAALQRHTLVIYQWSVLRKHHVPTRSLVGREAGIPGHVGRHSASVPAEQVDMAIRIEIEERLNYTVGHGNDFELAVGILKELGAGLYCLSFRTGVREPQGS